MTDRMKRFSPIVFTVALLGGCTQQAANVSDDAQFAEAGAKTVAELEVPRTIKPGAAVEFTHVLRFKVAPGEAGIVDFTVNEDYQSGLLKLEAHGSDGLSVFGASSSVQFSMDATRTHNWSVNFKAETDGVYYLNVSALAETEGEPGSRRGYAVRIEVGDLQKATKTSNSIAPTQMPSGETVIVMEAEETIE